MEITTLETQITALLEPILEDMGFELVQVKTLSNQGRFTLRVTADREGGITLDECAQISREIAPHLEVADPIPQRYNLEVSSPGIRRPLVRPADYERFRGETIAVRLSEAPEESLEGRKRFRGVNQGLDESGRLILTPDEGPERLSIRLDEIKEAHLDPEIGMGAKSDRKHKKVNKT